jgi:hypothetical protein
LEVGDREGWRICKGAFEVDFTVCLWVLFLLLFLAYIDGIFLAAARHTYMPKTAVNFGPSYFGGCNMELVMCAAESELISPCYLPRLTRKTIDSFLSRWRHLHLGYGIGSPTPPYSRTITQRRFDLYCLEPRLDRSFHVRVRQSRRYGANLE